VSDPTFTRERPNPLLRIAFKIPALTYAGPLAEFYRSRCVLRLTTTGRKSGQPRTICVSFFPHEGGYILFSGFGIQSHWYQNVRADPDVTIKVGRKEMPATARVVADPQDRRTLMLAMRDQSSQCGPPTWIRPILGFIRAFDYNAEIQMAVDHADKLPVVELTPSVAQSS
jgi:deazaflavin-dependent oxidoreductase (nitroreductase family)